MAAVNNFWSARTQAAIAAGERDERDEQEAMIRDHDEQIEHLRRQARARLPVANARSLSLISPEALRQAETAVGKVLGVELCTELDLGELIEPLLYNRLRVDLLVSNAALIDSYRHDFPERVPSFAIPDRGFMVITPANANVEDTSAPFGAMGERQYKEAQRRGFSERILADVNAKLTLPEARAAGVEFRVPLLLVPRECLLPDWTAIPTSEDGVTALCVVVPASGRGDMHTEMVYFALQRLLLDAAPRPEGAAGQVLEYAYEVQLTGIRLYVRWSSRARVARAGLTPLPPQEVVIRQQQQQAHPGS